MKSLPKLSLQSAKEARAFVVSISKPTVIERQDDVDIPLVPNPSAPPPPPPLPPSATRSKGDTETRDCMKPSAKHAFSRLTKRAGKNDEFYDLDELKPKSWNAIKGDVSGSSMNSDYRDVFYAVYSFQSNQMEKQRLESLETFCKGSEKLDPKRILQDGDYWARILVPLVFKSRVGISSSYFANLANEFSDPDLVYVAIYTTFVGFLW